MTTPYLYNNIFLLFTVHLPCSSPCFSPCSLLCLYPCSLYSLCLICFSPWRFHGKGVKGHLYYHESYMPITFPIHVHIHHKFSNTEETQTKGRVEGIWNICQPRKRNQFIASCLGMCSYIDQLVSYIMVHAMISLQFHLHTCLTSVVSRFRCNGLVYACSSRTNSLL